MVIYNKDTSNPDNIEIMEHSKGPLSSHAVLSDVLTDEEIEDLQVRLYNHALLVICSELTAEERTRSRNNIIREWFGEMCSRYVR